MHNFIKTNTKIDFKIEIKVVIENFIWTKSWRKFLEEPKQNVNIFIRIKNKFNFQI